MLPSIPLALSGERFGVAYRVRGNLTEAEARAREIALEQTVEFPAVLVPAGDIRDHMVGRLESLAPLDTDHCVVEISYALETVGDELTQLLNVIFGNTSLQPGIRVERLALPETLTRHWRGPRYGAAGWRELLDAPQRPLLCTALKPQGLPPAALAELAYHFALGGIDLIKDDHGLANQPFAPFEQRVELCAAAVARANAQTGYGCRYLPNITASADQLRAKALFAKHARAGGLLIAPGLTGFDAMRHLADDDEIALPLMAHPALLGSFVTQADQGLSHLALFGQLVRLAGADATIFPNFGGRFAFTQAECRQIAAGAAQPFGALKPILPAPGGGMSLARVPEMLATYGREVILLIGGGLHTHGPDLVENCRYFRRLVEEQASRSPITRIAENIG